MKYLYILTLILVAVSCNNLKKPKPNPSIPPKYAVTNEPKFKDHGDLFFISPTNDTSSVIDIEIAETFSTRETGLMHRKSMDINKGMLFIFDKEERQSFWMKNTHIPLDIIFVNNEKRIVHIAKDCQPYSLKEIPSFEYARYVVEVNAGYCDKYHIETGSYINFLRNN